MDRHPQNSISAVTTTLRRCCATLLTVTLAVLSLTAEEKGYTPLYYVNRIQNYIRVNAWSEAKREIDLGLKGFPGDPELRYYNGRYYYVVGNMNEARYNLARALQNDEMHFHSKRLLVDVEDTLKHYSSAICYINELLEFQPYDRDLWRRKIALYRKMGNTVEADAALTRLAQIYPNDTLVTKEVRKRTRDTWEKMLHHSNNMEAAANLEMWLDQDPDNLEYYLELVNVYEQMGEFEHGLGAVSRGLRHFPGNSLLANKGIAMLLKMGLHTHALEFAKQHHQTGMYGYLLQEIANNARANDPYEANGRLYAATGDRDALNYLINMSLTRGYYEDARAYLYDAMRKYGRTAPLLMKLYDLEKKEGNEQASIKVLEELYTQNPDNEDIVGQYAALMLRLGIHEMDGQQWTDAYKYLSRAMSMMTPEHDQWASTMSRMITVLGHLGRWNEARELYRRGAGLGSQEDAQRFASAYEDIAANRLRVLIEEEKYEEALWEAQALLDIVPGSQVALRCCINMCQTLKKDEQFRQYALKGYETYPDEPYFIVKYALSLQQQDRTAEALSLLRPRPGSDWTNPLLVTTHSGIANEWAEQLLKDRMPELALEVVDSALVHDPNNRELLYTKGVAYEHLKEWDKAYRFQQGNYNPSNAEQHDWYEHMRYLRFKSFKNRIDASYTTAYYDTKDNTLASIGHLYSIASVTYSRLCRHNTYTGQISYKGIDGYHTDEENESGGVGLEFMAQWEHTFNSRWSGMVNFAASTRYFNKIGANVSASYSANRGWTPSLRLGYRRTPDSYLYVDAGSAVEARLGEYNLFILTPSVEKSWERIKVTGSADLILMESSIYYNIGLKGKLFINEDNISSVSLVTGFGSFPELSFFDQTALSELSHTNAMVGAEFQYLLTRNLYIGLAGNWNTYYNPYRRSDGTLTDSYRNIFSITAQLHVGF